MAALPLSGSGMECNRRTSPQVVATQFSLHSVFSKCMEGVPAACTPPAQPLDGQPHSPACAS